MKLLPDELGRPWGPEASTQPVLKMSPKALGLVMRKNSRIDTILLSNTSREVIRVKIHS